MNILICVGVCEGAGSSFTKHDSKCLCPAVPSKAHFTVNFIFTHTHTHTHTARLSSQTYPIVSLFSSSNFLLVNLELFEYEGDIRILQISHMAIHYCIYHSRNFHLV